MLKHRMHLKKYLVTSGCSFTDSSSGLAATWAVHLEDSTGLILNNYGLSSSGNGLIYRQTMYGVDKLLSEGVNPKEILVGVMWSGANRQEIFTTEDSKFLLRKIANYCNLDIYGREPQGLKGLRNPYKFVPDSVGQWIIQNANWPDVLSQLATQINCGVSGCVLTYEKILALQYYLESVGVDYFFTSFFGGGTFPLDKVNLPADISWMHKLVDWEKWLPIDGQFEWCYDRGIKDYGLEGISTSRLDAKHPLSEHHKMFTEEVILPHLQKRNLI